MSGPDLQTLFQRAISGEQQAVGELLEIHRGFLRVLGQRWLDGEIDARLDASDLVQQTFLSAFRRFEQFEGDSPAEFVAWLRVIHDHNVRDALRKHVLAQKRTVALEVPFDEQRTGRATTPSQVALENERAVLLARSLEKLPPDQREVVRLRYLEGWSLADISARLDRSKPAISGLLARGMRAVKRLLKE